MKPLRILLVVVLVAVVAGVGIGIWQWNKPRKTVDGVQGIAISADSLVALFNADEPAANARFLNKAIAVRGIAKEISRNSDGQQTVLLATADGMTNVFCTMRNGQKVRGANPADAVVIKGFCSGKTMDVLLTDCIAVQ